MNCLNCGAELSEGSSFCGSCGSAVSNVETYIPPIPEINTNHVSAQSKGLFTNMSPFNLFMILLLSMITICVGYLAISQYKETKGKSQRRVLSVEIDSDIGKDKLSDSTQIKNAIENGGTMRVDPSDVDPYLDKKIGDFAALDDNEHYWVNGAILNYLASEGWELVQGPSSGLAMDYYFVK